MNDLSRQTLGVLFMIGLWIVLFCDDALRTWFAWRSRRRARR